MPVALSVVWPDKMTAVRKNSEQSQERFRRRFSRLVSPAAFDDLAQETGLSKAMIQRWWTVGVSQPTLENISPIAEYFHIENWKEYFYGDVEPDPPKANSPAKAASPETAPPVAPTAESKAPAWMHQALDEAYSTPYSDFIHLIVSFAAKRTGT